MAECPHLKFESHTWSSDCRYICGFTGERYDMDSPKVKEVCKPDYGEKYRDCPIWKKYAK